MIRKIVRLSKIFIKDYFNNLYIFNKETKKIKMNSAFTWLIIIIIVSITLGSAKIIDFLYSVGQEILFFKIYLPFLATIFMLQAVLVCCNVFFFSKDLEYILPLPIKPIELLLSKFNNVISITYCMEAIFLVIPLIVYGIITIKLPIYYLIMILVIIIFPIFFVGIVSIIMLIVMQLTRFIKNKDIFQILLVMVLTMLIISVESYLIKDIFSRNIVDIEIDENSEIQSANISMDILNAKIDKLNNYFVVINPSLNLLTNFKWTNIIIQFAKIILIDLIIFSVFIVCGKVLYLKNILKNIEYINVKKDKNKITNKKYKKYKVKNSYIINEIRKVVKNPTFFLQCIFQYILFVIVLLMLINFIFPMIIDNFRQEDYINKLGYDNFVLQCMCILLGILQIIITFGNLSITAISRDGSSAMVTKYIPVALTKQFVWKNIPQVIINLIPIIGTIIVIFRNIPGISIYYYIVWIILAMLLNIINCLVMSIIDFKRPKLDWLSESALLKDNRNKSYQYVTAIINILILIYFTKIFSDVKITISLFSIMLFFSIILILIIIYIKKNINKIFSKII